MTELSQTILEKWQIRKTKAQKTAFIDFLTGQIPGLRVEKSGLFKSRNLVLGDVASAEVILCGHYDTCARLPFPNFITPKNILIYLLYNLVVAVPFLALFVLVMNLVNRWTENFALAYWLGFAAMMGTMGYVFMGGKPNRHTANDNTSGVITLCELAAALTPEQRERVCIVFFDNEENGLLGSSAFARRHKKDGLKDKLVLNFDCVSDGDNFLFVQSKAAQKRFEEPLRAAFVPEGGKKVEFTTSARAIYPSDQANFPMGVGVAALNRHRVVGLYMNKIHTKADTVFQTENIALLVSGTQRLLEQL